MLANVLLGLAAVVGLFLVYIAMQSSKMRIERSVCVLAAAERIFPYINHSEKMYEWMPWQEADPSARINYSGPIEGVGAMSTWDSPGKMGTGQAKIVESIPNQVVRTELIYTKPMKMSQIAEVSLMAKGNETVVTWSVSGENTFVGRLFCFFINMDKQVGQEFDKGLRKLKSITEARTK